MRRWLRMLLRLWEQAKREHCTPHEIGWSVGVGVLCGCTPFVGLHMWMAIALATLFRLNRLWAFIGSRISFSPLFALIAFCEIEAAHRLRTGRWAPLTAHDAATHGKELLGDWLLGAALVGTGCGAAVGLAAYVSMRSWQSYAGRRTTRKATSS